MSSFLVLVLVSVLGVIHARPKHTEHKGLYDDLKVVPFVDKQEEAGTSFGQYTSHGGNTNPDTTNPNTDSQKDKFEQYYDKFNKIKDRQFGGGSSVDTDISDEVDKETSVLPVEGGIEDMNSNVLDVEQNKKTHKDKSRRHRHRGKGNGRRHGKNKKNKKAPKVEESVGGVNDLQDDNYLGSEDLDESGFTLEKFYQENPGFKKNIATITDGVVTTPTSYEDVKGSEDDADSTEQKEANDEDDTDSFSKDMDNSFNRDENSDSENVDTDDIVKDTYDSDETTDDDDIDDDTDGDDDDDEYDDDDDDDVDDVDDEEGVKLDESNEIDDETDSEDSDDVVDETGDEFDEAKRPKDGESHDVSSEAFDDYYDYYDEPGDSSYSSSEVEAENGQYGSPYDWFKQHDRMYGDQPAQPDENKSEKKHISTSIKVKYVDNENKLSTLKPLVSSYDKAKFGDGSLPENIPKTDIEPSTSPNPPTPKKDLKSTVTQPSYPDWKLKTGTWNFIESRPVEACAVDSDCHAGRMCKFGLCLCGRPDYCEGHSKRVCGSDGRLYPSHCELHRTACVLGVHIRIDLDDGCMKGVVSTEKPKVAAITTKPDVLKEDIVTSEKKIESPKIKAIKITHDHVALASDKQDVKSEVDSKDSADIKPDKNIVLSDTKPNKIKASDVATDVVLGDAGTNTAKNLIDNKVNVEENNSVDKSESNVDKSMSDDKDSHEEVVTKEEKVDSAESAEDVGRQVQQVKNPLDSVTVEEGGAVADGKKERVNEADAISCNPDLYEQFKADVLLYHCVFFESPNCDRQSQEEKQRLSAMMFNYYDHNENGKIEQEELWEMQLRESIDEISSLCSLLDIAKFDDLGERDGVLSADEFIQAFDIPDLQEHKLEVVPLLATVGNGLEVKCDVTASPDVAWIRNKVDLSLLGFPGISVLADGSLYLETVGVHHVGNLTCFSRKKPSIRQTHMLTIQKPPHVQVSPQTLDCHHGSDVVLHCHADGYPSATVEWMFEDKIVEQGAKYHIQSYDNSLTIMSVDYKTDAGLYKCEAKNSAGSASASVKVTVHSPNNTKQIMPPRQEESFIIFHDDGYTMHEPSECVTQRHVKPEYGNFHYIPDELDAPPALCEVGVPCVWGGAINVKDMFVYVTQPRENRIVVIDVKDTFNPDQVIFTDHMPVSLHYVAHLDEVWVLCWNGEEDSGSKTVVIIRNASQKTQHHAIHTQPIGNRFDLVQDIFLPPSSDLHHPYHFGYTVHKGQQGLFKVDLVQKKYIKAVDLTKYACVPQAVAFVPLGGQVLVQCRQRTDWGERDVILQLDYVTDQVVANLSLPGTPYVTPDSNKVVIVNEQTGKIAVFQVTENGEIKKQFEVTVGSRVGGVTFHKASYNQGYDLYMTSIGDPVIFSVSLMNGKVDEIRNIGEADLDMYLPWFHKSRPLVSGDVFSDYLSTTANSAMVILNGKQHSIQCDYEDLMNPAVIAFTHIGIK